MFGSLERCSIQGKAAPILLQTLKTEGRKVPAANIYTAIYLSSDHNYVIPFCTVIDVLCHNIMSTNEQLHAQNMLYATLRAWVLINWPV